MLPAETWDVGGGSDPSTWHYRISLGGPDRTLTLDPVPSAGVVHIKYSTDPSTPWRGVGPIESASLAGKLSAEVSAALGDELSGPVGALLPVSADGDDPTVTSLKDPVPSRLSRTCRTIERLGVWRRGSG